MTSISPVATICHVLQQVCDTATTNAVVLRKNEAATRAALVDPVLRALGWDTANVQMVEPEKTLSGDLRVDYLLQDAAKKPQIVIEAKCLNSNLDKYAYVGKILGYAIALKVQTVCITDGITWSIYSDLHQGKSEPLNFVVEDGSLLLAANQLIRWLDAAQCGHGVPSVIQKLIAVQEPKTTLPKPVVPIKIKPAAKVKNPHLIDLNKLHLVSLTPGQKPVQLRLPDGTTKAIKTWKDILLETCLLVLATNNNLPLPLPDKAGKKRSLISHQKPATGGSVAAFYKQEGVFIGTNYSAADCIANALYAVNQLPAGKKTVPLAISF